MRTVSGPGGVETTIFEIGDMVRLRKDEEGAVITARAGEWGRVTRVQGNGALDILLAGYSRPKDHPAPRVTNVSRALVDGCDTRGLPLAEGAGSVWASRRAR